MKWYYNVGFTVLVMVTTLLIRVPIPGGGYFNLGDSVIIFAALYGGKKTGAFAGGVGSALADLIGFPVFAPITLIAKGLLGLLAGCAYARNGWQRVLFSVLGAATMIIVYFGGTWLLPSLGKAAALADLPANLLQASLGVVGGSILFSAWQRLDAIRK